MKCVINGQEVNAKVTENLGYQAGYYAKAVEYEGKEYIVVKRSSGIWETRKPVEKIQFSGYRGV